MKLRPIIDRSIKKNRYYLLFGKLFDIAILIFRDHNSNCIKTNLIHAWSFPCGYCFFKFTFFQLSGYTGNINFISN